MSSTAVLGFIKDINNKNLKAVNDRLKKEKPNQRYSDPKAEGLVYTLLHAAVATGSQEITAALLKAGADVNARDSKGKTPLAWLAVHTNSEPHMKLAGMASRGASNALYCIIQHLETRCVTGHGAALLISVVYLYHGRSFL
jgi:hypothetical protein